MVCDEVMKNTTNWIIFVGSIATAVGFSYSSQDWFIASVVSYVLGIMAGGSIMDNLHKK